MRFFVIFAAILLTDAIRGTIVPPYESGTLSLILGIVVLALLMDIMEFIKRMND